MSTRIVVLIIIITAPIFSQIRNTYSFLNPHYDALIPSKGFWEVGMFALEDNRSDANLFIRSEYRINSKISLGAEIVFFDFISKLSAERLIITGKYNLIKGSTLLSFGPYIESNIVAGDIQHIGFYSSLRHHNSDKFESFLKGAIISIDDGIFSISGGGFYYINERINFVGEQTNTYKLSSYYNSEYMLISFGTNYKVMQSIFVRSSIGYNIISTSPGLMINMGIQYFM
jgi:hypothetical protein